MECLKDFALSVFASAICTAVWTFVLYQLRPKLNIEDLYVTDGKIKVKVVNNGRSKAVNLQMEVCTVKKGEADNITKHFSLDKEDFLILPPNENRIFKADLDGKIEDKIKDKDTSVRVRVYSTHSYSGFGKAEEEEFFQYNAQTGKFKKK
ncbi:hypothetical protein AGMMS4957_16240 [Bacteroidia bacterium]|nr:hypothetical protein AGMMS4957_16240 [Bacteroidia bacterium]